MWSYFYFGSSWSPSGLGWCWGSVKLFMSGRSAHQGLAGRARAAPGCQGPLSASFSCCHRKTPRPLPNKHNGIKKSVHFSLVQPEVGGPDGWDISTPQDDSGTQVPSVVAPLFLVWLNLGALLHAQFSPREGAASLKQATCF